MLWSCRATASTFFQLQQDSNVLKDSPEGEGFRPIVVTINFWLCVEIGGR